MGIAILASLLTRRRVANASLARSRHAPRVANLRIRVPRARVVMSWTMAIARCAQGALLTVRAAARPRSRVLSARVGIYDGAVLHAPVVLHRQMVARNALRRATRV